MTTTATQAEQKRRRLVETAKSWIIATFVHPNGICDAMCASEWCHVKLFIVECETLVVSFWDCFSRCTCPIRFARVWHFYDACIASSVRFVIAKTMSICAPCKKETTFVWFTESDTYIASTEYTTHNPITKTAHAFQSWTIYRLCITNLNFVSLPFYSPLTLQAFVLVFVVVFFSFFFLFFFCFFSFFFFYIQTIHVFDTKSNKVKRITVQLCASTYVRKFEWNTETFLCV